MLLAAQLRRPFFARLFLRPHISRCSVAMGVKRQQNIEGYATPSGKGSDSSEQDPTPEPQHTRPSKRHAAAAEAPAGENPDADSAKQGSDAAAADSGGAARGQDRAGKKQQQQGDKEKRKGEQDEVRGQGPAGQQEEGPFASPGSPTKELPENTVEQGRLFFLYKPKVTAAGAAPHVSNLDDVQRMFMLLQPQVPPGAPCRLVVVAKKKLPDPAKHERFFAFVEAVAASPAELTSGLTESSHTTKTRGERLQPAARAAGEGPYVIAKGGARGGVHLAYKLDLPAGGPGEAQAVLGIKQEGSFVLSVKNPAQKGRAGVPSAGPPPAYSEAQLAQFKNRAWIGAEDPSLLDVVGSELLLVGAKDDPVETGELGPAGELLQELSEDEQQQLEGLGQEGQQQQLREALEPTSEQDQAGAAAGGSSGSGGRGGAGGEAEQGGAAADAIPIAPAVTGKLE